MKECAASIFRIEVTFTLKMEADHFVFTYHWWPVGYEFWKLPSLCNSGADTLPVILPVVRRTTMKIMGGLKLLVLSHERTIPTERSPLVGEIIANFCEWRVSRCQRDGSLRPYSQSLDRSGYFFFPIAPQLYSRG
jgi:hypothetical protein